MGTPFFTVVIPSYNQGQFIDYTISSLLNQNYPHLEIIVMDGGSTDDTVERLKSYGNNIKWVSQNDGGQTDALIKGFAHASGNWFAWLNSDDFHTNNALHVVAAAIAKHADADVVIGNGHYANPDGSFMRTYPRVKCGPGIDMADEFFMTGYVAQPSVYFRKDAYNRVGGLNPAKNLCMDYDLWVRLATGGCKFIAVDEDISGNRWYEDTKTSTQLEKLYYEVISTQQQFFNKTSPFFIQALSDFYFSKLAAKFQNKTVNTTVSTTANRQNPGKAERLIGGGSLLARWLFFKLIIIKLNRHNPPYLLRLLMDKQFRRGGALAEDNMSFIDICQHIISNTFFQRDS